MSTTKEQLAQQMGALQRANDIRSSNAMTKKYINGLPRAEALVHAANVVRYPIGPEVSLQLGAVVTSVPMLGAVKADRLAKRHGVRLHTRLGVLPPGKREAVAKWLEAQA